MNLHYDLAQAEIATRLHHAEYRRSAKHARTRAQSVRLSQRQRLRSP